MDEGRARSGAVSGDRIVADDHPMRLATWGLALTLGTFLACLSVWALHHGRSDLPWLVAFSCAIVVASWIYRRVAGGHYELGLVPLAAATSAIAMMVWASGATNSSTVARVALGAVLGACISLAYGPLHDFVRARCDTALARKRASAQLVRSGALVAALTLAWVCGAYLWWRSSVITLSAVALVVVVASTWAYTVVPEFTLRLFAAVLSRLMYRLDVIGIECVPKTGGAILICNHVSFVDWLLIGGAISRPVRFVMAKEMFELPVARWICTHGKVIPIAGRREDPELLEEAFRRIDASLRAGDLVCIFPEGKITRDGAMNAFRPGVERALASTPVPVVPMALRGLWGSAFSRVDGRALRRPFRRGLRNKVALHIGQPVPPNEVSMSYLQDLVEALHGSEPRTKEVVDTDL